MFDLPWDAVHRMKLRRGRAQAYRTQTQAQWGREVARVSGGWLQELTWEEFREAKGSARVVIVPVGSTEQHGPHLPLGTDSMVAITVAEDASRRTGALIAPPLWYGWSPHHMALDGTISVRAEVLAEVLYDVTESLARHGLKRFVYLNGHRIVNIAWMQIAAERAQRLLGVEVVIFDPGHMSKEISDGLGFGPLGHAEEIETSHMYSRYSALCKPERAHDSPPSPAALYSVDPRYPMDTLCYVPSTAARLAEVAPLSRGVSGSPRRASPEKGRIYHEHLVGRLVEVIGRLQQA
jgi:creatinine amidohydrolase